MTLVTWNSPGVWAAESPPESEAQTDLPVILDTPPVETDPEASQARTIKQPREPERPGPERPSDKEAKSNPDSSMAGFLYLGGGRGVTGGIIGTPVLSYRGWNSQQLEFFVADVAGSEANLGSSVGIGFYLGYNMYRTIDIGLDGANGATGWGVHDETLFEFRAGPALEVISSAINITVSPYLVGNYGDHKDHAGAPHHWGYALLCGLARVETRWMEAFATFSPLDPRIPSHAHLFLDPGYFRVEARSSVLAAYGANATLADESIDTDLLVRFGQSSDWGLLGGVAYRSGWKNEASNLRSLFKQRDLMRDRLLVEAGLHFPPVGWTTLFHLAGGGTRGGGMYLNSVQVLRIRTPDGSWLWGGGINRMQDGISAGPATGLRAIAWFAAASHQYEGFLGIQVGIGMSGLSRKP